MGLQKLTNFVYGKKGNCLKCGEVVEFNEKRHSEFAHIKNKWPFSSCSCGERYHYEGDLMADPNGYIRENFVSRIV